MTDPRFRRLAKLLAEYSTGLRKDDRVLLDLTDVPDEFAVELIRAARATGAIPLVEVRHTRVNREILRGTNQRHATLVRDLEMFRMKKVQAYIAIRGTHNVSEASDVASDLMTLYSKVLRTVYNNRVNKSRWVVLRWRPPSMSKAVNGCIVVYDQFSY